MINGDRDYDGIPDLNIDSDGDGGITHTLYFPTVSLIVILAFSFVTVNVPFLISSSVH